MRLMYKLVALALLGGIFQIAFEAVGTITSFPADVPNAWFGDAESQAVIAAQRRFEGASPVARWVVKDLLAMPYVPAASL